MIPLLKLPPIILKIPQTLPSTAAAAVVIDGIHCRNSGRRIEELRN
jgi:hypothetical protein